MTHSVRIERIPIDRLIVPDIRVSAKFTDEQRAMLKSTIQRLGVIQDPVVRPLPDGKYEVSAGAHRIKELREQGATEIDCKVVDVDTRTSIEMNITENLARGSYDPMEVSQQLNNYLQHGGTIDDLVKLTGHSREWVEKYLSLIKLPERCQDALSKGTLRIGHIEEAFRLDREEEIYSALQTAVIHRWPTTVLRNYVNNRLAELEAVEEARRMGLQPPEVPPPRPELADFADCFGCKRKVIRRDLRLPQLCNECWSLLTYCTSQLGEPRDAMQRIYNAVTFKARYDEWQRFRFEQFERETRGPPSRAPPSVPERYPPRKPEEREE